MPSIGAGAHSFATIEARLAKTIIDDTASIGAGAHSFATLDARLAKTIIDDTDFLPTKLIGALSSPDTPRPSIHDRSAGQPLHLTPRRNIQHQGITRPTRRRRPDSAPPPEPPTHARAHRHAPIPEILMGAAQP